MWFAALVETAALASNTIDKRARKALSFVFLGRCSPFSAQESLESGHGLPAAAVSEDELVEVGLELTAVDAMMGAYQPSLQVANGSVGEGHDRFATLRHSDLRG